MNDLLAVRSKTAMSLGFHIVVFKGGKVHMLERDTIRRAMQEKRTSKKPTTQAGEFAREEMHHIREGKHGLGPPSKRLRSAVEGSQSRSPASASSKR